MGDINSRGLGFNSDIFGIFDAVGFRFLGGWFYKIEEFVVYFI